MSFNEHSFSQNPLQKESSSSKGFPTENCGEGLGDKNVCFIESETNENLILFFEAFSRKEFEMSELYSVHSSENDFENSNQNDTKTSVENVEQYIF